MKTRTILRKLILAVLMTMILADLKAVTVSPSGLSDMCFLYVTGESCSAGKTATLTLNMRNNYPVSSWKCDLVLPDGVTFLGLELIPDRQPNGYEAKVTTDENDDGSIAIICDGPEGIGLTGTDGPVATITVSVAKKVPSGIHVVTLKDISLWEADEAVLQKEYTEFKRIVMGGSAPFVEEGKKWLYHSLAVRPDGDIWEWDETYSLEGDTAIGSHNCHKLYFSSTDPYPCVHRYKGALYQSGRKVYYIAPDNTTSTLLYDFYSVPGETIEVGGYRYGGRNEYLITKKRLASYRGKYLTVTEWDQKDGDRYWREEGEPSSWYDDMVWIEGIGNRRDLLNEYSEWYTGGGVPHLEKCTLNGEVLYEYDDFEKNAVPVEEGQTSKVYFPEGTKWTEIRLDTMKYDTWYSKVGDELVPNFETIEYHITDEAVTGWHSVDKYTNIGEVTIEAAPEWMESYAFSLIEKHDESNTHISAYIQFREYGQEYDGMSDIYQFGWNVGQELYYQDMYVESMAYPGMTGVKGRPTLSPSNDGRHSFGTIEEIRESNFGGVRPLKYVDLNGVRIVEGIGVTEWNDGECLFGPVNIYSYSNYPQTAPERHYRSMLVHFERDGEVLYDVWPEKVTVGMESPAPSCLPQWGEEVFDLSGRKVAAEALLQRGSWKGARIYIKDGRKVVTK